MSDQLEDFVRQNRSAFDDKEPSEKVWKNVEASIKMKSKVSLWNSVMVWRAAAILFMALTAFLLIPKKISEKITEKRSDRAALNEFSDVEAFYTKEISDKVDLIGSFEQSEGLNGFTRDFKQLEAMYDVLREEMKAHPSAKVKDALVLNLLVRIDLLNQQLHKLEEGGEKEVKEEKKAANV